MDFDQHFHVAWCSLRGSCPGRSGGEAGKGRRAGNYVSGI